MKPGEIRRALYVGSTGAIGPEPKRVLILAVGPAGVGEDEVVVIAYITTFQGRIKEPLLGDIPLDDTDIPGLTEPSVVRCRQFASIPRARIGERLGEVDTPTLIRAQDIARNILG